MATSIAAAIVVLDELNLVLDKAYWESSAIEAKDSIYDCISSLNKELSELNKLSIQDHDLAYEPTSYEFKNTIRRLSELSEFLSQYILKTSTVEHLSQVITSTLGLNRDETKSH